MFPEFWVWPSQQAWGFQGQRPQLHLHKTYSHSTRVKDVKLMKVDKGSSLLPQYSSVVQAVRALPDSLSVSVSPQEGQQLTP